MKIKLKGLEAWLPERPLFRIEHEPNKSYTKCKICGTTVKEMASNPVYGGFCKGPKIPKGWELHSIHHRQDSPFKWMRTKDLNIHYSADGKTWVACR